MGSWGPDMRQLSKPDPSLVERVLAEVDYQHRLVAYRYRRRIGAVPVTLYSFEEVVHVLHDKSPRLDWKQLEEWVRAVVGDEDLAAAIAHAVAREVNDHDRTMHIKHLMAERLCQCRLAADPIS